MKLKDGLKVDAEAALMQVYHLHHHHNDHHHRRRRRQYPHHKKKQTSEEKEKGQVVISDSTHCLRYCTMGTDGESV
ncbi:hypothetical protein L6452_37340 [Arctium lappa]|uniref:Uncharacterized protein n=1 Tax=Arctium lappa TaxID=4217 RepID=A0ACB8Y3E2_ARCLA|nr:hypothetical protein L6452_37340 [Arctium lappa]